MDRTDNEMVAALHTSARRYCMERIAACEAEYKKLVAHNGHSQWQSRQGTWVCTVEAKSLLSRSEVLYAILESAEYLRPEEVGDLQEAREWLIIAGHVAQNFSTQSSFCEQDVMNEERTQFATYIQGLTIDNLSHIEPVPYRRGLSREEVIALKAMLEQRWGEWGMKGGCWYPICVSEVPPHTVALRASLLNKAIKDGFWQRMLSQRGIERIWELREDNSGKEIEPSLFEPCYGGTEGCWTSGETASEMNWLIYASHEDSLTLTGEWLLEALGNEFPQWREFLYVGWWERDSEEE